MCICICICMYIYIYIYTCIYTYIYSCMCREMEFKGFFIWVFPIKGIYKGFYKGTILLLIDQGLGFEV